MFNDQDLAASRGTSATIGIGTWMAFDCLQLLNLIPILGSIVLLVILIVMACSEKTAPSIKNRILSYFIWVGISIALCIIALIVLMTTGIWAYMLSMASH
jgi:hypothetical protein